MQQVPAVEIDGVTLSQSVSLNILLCHPRNMYLKQLTDSTENVFFPSHSWQ